MERKLDERYEKRCEKCEHIYPPMQMLKWDGTMLKRNTDWNGKWVCYNCYNDLNYRRYKIKLDGKIRIGSDFYRGDMGFNIHQFRGD